MSPLKSLPRLVCALSLAAMLPAFGQLNTEYAITKVETNFIPSPTYSGPRYVKRGFKPGEWLEVEVTFDWKPRAKEPKFTDELTFNYYILLKNKSQEAPKGTLLVGSVTHVNIPQGKDMHSVVYVSPRSLERFFEGKVPGTPNATVAAVAVTITKQGQKVAESVGGSFKSGWWNEFPSTSGFVLNKNQTPFAPLAWDYYEAIKPTPSGR